MILKRPSAWTRQTNKNNLRCNVLLLLRRVLNTMNCTVFELKNKIIKFVLMKTLSVVANVNTNVNTLNF